MNEKHNELIEYSEPNGKIRIYTPDNIKIPKSEYHINTSHLKYIINWERFFILVREEKTGLQFDVALKTLLKTKPKERKTSETGPTIKKTRESDDIKFIKNLGIIDLSPRSNEEDEIKTLESVRKFTKPRDEEYILAISKTFKYLNKPFERPNAEVVLQDSIQGEAKVSLIV